MKKWVVLIVGVIALAVTLGYYFRPSEVLYTNLKQGVSFSYPRAYELKERQIDFRHFAVILTKKGEQIPVNGEGPTSLVLDIYEGVDSPTLAEWLRNDEHSNYKLARGKLTLLLVDDVPGLSYAWDGLYRGLTVAVLKDRKVYAFSGTYNSVTDQIRKDFDVMMTSAKFLK